MTADKFVFKKCDRLFWATLYNYDDVQARVFFFFQYHINRKHTVNYLNLIYICSEVTFKMT